MQRSSSLIILKVQSKEFKSLVCQWGLSTDQTKVYVRYLVTFFYVYTLCMYVYSYTHMYYVYVCSYLFMAKHTISKLIYLFQFKKKKKTDAASALWVHLAASMTILITKL